MGSPLSAFVVVEHELLSAAVWSTLNLAGFRVAAGLRIIVGVELNKSKALTVLTDRY